MRQCGTFIGFLAATLLIAIPASVLAQPAPSEGERRGWLLTGEEERAVEQAALANSQMRGLLGTDRPRVVSVTAEPNKSEAGAYLAGISVATPSRRITIVLFNLARPIGRNQNRHGVPISC